MHCNVVFIVLYSVVVYYIVRWENRAVGRSENSGGKVVIHCLLKEKDLLLFRKKNLAALPPSGPTALFLEAIINCLCRVRRFVWQAKMTNRKKSIKICVCVHPPIYSSTTTDPLPSLPPTKIISIIINAD